MSVKILLEFMKILGKTNVLLIAFIDYLNDIKHM